MEQYWTLNEVEVPKGTLFSQCQFEGMARGSAVLASQNVVWVMAVWELQLRGPETALERSCRRLKFEQVRASAQ